MTKTKNRVEQVLDWFKNNKMFSILIIFGVIIIGIEKTTSSISTLVNLFNNGDKAPQLIQFALNGETSYQEKESSFYDKKVISFEPDPYFLKSPFNYPIFLISLENPNDKDMVVTHIKYHVDDITGERGGEPGALKSAYQYEYVLEYKKGIQTHKLVPPFKIPAKSAGAFELVLTTKHPDLGRIWYMSMEFLTSTGAVETEKILLQLSGKPTWWKSN